MFSGSVLTVGTNMSGLHMLRNNLLDLDLWGRKPGSSGDLIEDTKVTGNVAFSTGQYVKPHSRVLDLSSFLTSNLHLFGFLVLGYLLMVVTTTILPKLIHENWRSPLRGLKLMLCWAPFIDHGRLPSARLRLMFSFFSLFLFFGLIILGGAMRTEKVNVPTNELVDSRAKLLAVSKTLVVNKFGSELIKMAPTGSFLKKLSTKNIFQLRTLSDVAQVEANGIEHCVIIGPRGTVFYSLQHLSTLARDTGSVGFFKPFTFFEELRSYQMRRGLEEETKKFVKSRCFLLVYIGVQKIESNFFIIFHSFSL